MANGFVHVELTTGDVGAAKAFYGKLFDWKMTDQEMGPGFVYTMLDAGDGELGGGMQPKPMPETPSMWLPYVVVSSVKETVAKAAAAGATILVPYQPIPGMGALGIFADPQGAVLGLWEPSPEAMEARQAAQAAVAKQAAAPARKAAAKKPAPAKKKAAAKKAAPAKKKAAPAKKKAAPAKKKQGKR